jgi:hypothetical protein
MSAHARYSEEDRERREYAVTVIQRTLRGHSSRKIAAAMRAERRVVMALQTLMSELSSPEMKGAGKSILQVLFSFLWFYSYQSCVRPLLFLFLFLFLSSTASSTSFGAITDIAWRTSIE